MRGGAVVAHQSHNLVHIGSNPIPANFSIRRFDMPRRDGTGPDGQGPRTGRGAGNCPPKTKDQSTVYPKPSGGRPRGGGRGRNRR